MASKFGYLDDSDTGNWNVAREYSENKIMRWLADADDYEMVATFGTAEFMDEFIMNNVERDMAKVKAIQWLTKTLLMVCENTWFAVKEFDKEKIKDYISVLKQIYEKFIPMTYEEIYNQITKQKAVKIKEKYFDEVLKTLIEIKREINEPLNKADLIFINKEMFDPKNFKQTIINEAINEG